PRRLRGGLVALLALGLCPLGDLLREVLPLLRAAMALCGLLAQLLRLLALLDDALLLGLPASEHDRCQYDDRGNCDHDPDPGSHRISLLAVHAGLPVRRGR